MFDLTGRGTVLVIEPLEGVVAADDVIEIPMRQGGTRSTPILGVEFQDGRLASGELESSLALVVAHLPAAALKTPVDAEVLDRSVVALSGFELAILNRACRAGGQDRAAAWPRAPGLIVALADGAGGVGGGPTAAQTIVDAAQAWTPLSKTADDLIRDLDRHLFSTTGGQSTAVILSLCHRHRRRERRRLGRMDRARRFGRGRNRRPAPKAFGGERRLRSGRLHGRSAPRRHAARGVGRLAQVREAERHRSNRRATGPPIGRIGAGGVGDSSLGRGSR